MRFKPKLHLNKHVTDTHLGGFTLLSPQQGITPHTHTHTHIHTHTYTHTHTHNTHTFGGPSMLSSSTERASYASRAGNSERMREAARRAGRLKSSLLLLSMSWDARSCRFQGWDRAHCAHKEPKQQVMLRVPMRG